MVEWSKKTAKPGFARLHFRHREPEEQKLTLLKDRKSIIVQRGNSMYVQIGTTVLHLLMRSHVYSYIGH